MAIRYTDGKLGMVFAAAAAQEDHRKPNIIRGNTKNFSKFPTRRNIHRNNTFETTLFREAISSTGVDQNVVTFPITENQNGHGGHFDSIMPSTLISEQLEEDEGSSEDQQIYITDEFHQLIQPSEISPLQNHEELMHASIQTDSGNYIMVIRDNEIVSMHSEQLDDDGGGGEDPEVESSVVEENGEGDDLHGTTECEEVEASNLDCDVDDEITTAVQNIDPKPERDLFTEEEEEGEGYNSIDDQNQDGSEQILGFVEESNSPGEQGSGDVANNSEQYVMVQLSDGNSYLIPASSLEGSSVAVDGSTCGEQIFVNENGDHQVIQVLNTSNTSSGLQLQHSTSTSVTSHAAPNFQHIKNHSRARKREHFNYESSSTMAPPPKKRIHNMNTATNGHTNNNSRYFPSSTSTGITSRTSHQQMYTTTNKNSQQYPQQKPLPQSRSRSSASSTVSNRPRPVEKPRPFRFDMPEDEIVRIDPSTDYLSLVIENFQKENYLKVSVAIWGCSGTASTLDQSLWSNVQIHKRLPMKIFTSSMPIFCLSIVIG